MGKTRSPTALVPATLAHGKGPGGLSTYALPVTERSPSVLHLAVHEPGGQIVYYAENNVPGRLQATERMTFTEYFAVNESALDDEQDTLTA